jgi:predicted hydrocarbon binding protein
VAWPTASDSSSVHYSNLVVRLLLVALEEVLGRSGVNAVLNLAQLRPLIQHYPPSDQERPFTLAQLSGLLRALDEMYGPRAGRGLALRAGRATFKYALKDLGMEQDLAERGFRLQPLHQKLKMVIDACAAVFDRQVSVPIEVGDEGGRLTWRMAQCPECWGRQAAEPCCYLAVGLLQESVYWASNGKNFEVEETTCVARGDPACTIVIDKQPLE